MSAIESKSLPWDVIVVGAGPAGSMVARGLARRRRRVLLVDRATFPRDKVCGCCLSAAAMRALDSVGLGALPERIGGRRLDELTWVAGGRRAHVPLAGGVSVSRGALDSALAGAAEDAGACFAPGVVARVLGSDGDGRQVELGCREGTVTVRARTIVVATGLGGKLLTDGDLAQERIQSDSYVGIGAMLTAAPGRFRNGAIEMACGTHGYVGFVRVEDDRVDVAAAVRARWIKEHGGPGAAVDAILREAGCPVVEPLRDAKWRGTTLLTRQRMELASDGVFVVGDAAGYVEPFTGEGMSWAIHSANALVPIADAACDGWSASLGERWATTHHELVRRRQRICSSLAWILRRRRLTTTLVKLVAAYPALGRAVVTCLNR